MYSLIDGSVYIGEFKSDNINGKVVSVLIIGNLKVGRW